MAEAITNPTPCTTQTAILKAEQVQEVMAATALRDESL